MDFPVVSSPAGSFSQTAAVAILPASSPPLCHQWPVGELSELRVPYVITARHSVLDAGTEAR